MARFQPSGPHSWGKEEGSWGTPPNPRQELLLHLSSGPPLFGQRGITEGVRDTLPGPEQRATDWLSAPAARMTGTISQRFPGQFFLPSVDVLFL